MTRKRPSPSARRMPAAEASSNSTLRLASTVSRSMRSKSTTSVSASCTNVRMANDSRRAVERSCSVEVMNQAPFWLPS
jgi:hypothetical protein